MSGPTTLTVRLSGALRDHVLQATGEHGVYENVSEYVRDLIRKDKDRAEQQRLERLSAELRHAFAAPDDSYVAVTADQFLARARQG